jgi:hypothetical protein
MKARNPRTSELDYAFEPATPEQVAAGSKA